MTYDRTDLHAYAADSERRDRDRRNLGANTDTTARQHRWLRIGAAVLMILVGLGVWALVAAEPGSTPEARPLDRVIANGQTLALHFPGQACETANAERTQVRETADAVHVTLYVNVPTAGCPEGQHHDVESTYDVTLDQPLRDRNVIDEACRFPAFGCSPDHLEVE